MVLTACALDGVGAMCRHLARANHCNRFGRDGRLRSSCRSRDQCVVLDCGEWFVEVVEQLFPLLIFGRIAKPFCVIFKRLPIHRPNVARFVFKTSLQLMTNIAIHRRDSRFCFTKYGPKLSFLSRFHIKNSCFQYRTLRCSFSTFYQLTY